MTSHASFHVKSSNRFFKTAKLARKARITWAQARDSECIKGNLSAAKGAKGRGVVFLSLWAVGILSYSAYICESCYWCNCIEVLATICSPLGGPGSSRRQWSGYERRITTADVLTEKKLPFQIFPTAANKIQMLDWSGFFLAPSSLLLLSSLCISCPFSSHLLSFPFVLLQYCIYFFIYLPSTLSVPPLFIHPHLLLSPRPLTQSHS